MAGRGFRIPERGIPFKPASTGRKPGVKTTNALDAASNAGGGIMDWIMGGVSMLPQIGVPLVAGAAVGTAYANTNRAPAVSGRGAGRSTFNSKPAATAQPPQKQETQAERTARINAGAREAVTPRGHELAGAAGMMSGRTGPGPAPQSPQPQGSGNITNIGGKSYDLSIPEQKAAYDQVIAADRASRPNQQFADIRGGGGLKADGSGRFTPAPNGSGAQGTRTGPAPMTMEDANKILNRGGLEGKGYTMQNPFESNQLPTTSGSPYESPVSNIGYDRELPENMFIQEGDLKLSSNAFDAGSGVEYGANIPQMPASGKIEYEQTAGRPLNLGFGVQPITKANEFAQQPEINKVPPRPRGARAGEKWDQQYGRTPQPVEREKSDLEKGYKPDLERRRAFLDGDLNSMEALRAIEAQKGIMVTGNTYNVVNPNAGKEGENDFKQITKGERDTIMRGGEGAQNLLNSYVGGIQEVQNTEGNKFKMTDSELPTSPNDATASVNPAQITDAPDLTQQVDVRFTDKDKTGRYNAFK